VLKTLSVTQLVNLGSDSLNSAIKTCEEVRDKFVSGGDHNESLNQKLDQILEQLNRLAIDLDNDTNDCSPIYMFEVLIATYLILY